jgi:hypothetical protein
MLSQVRRGGGVGLASGKNPDADLLGAFQRAVKSHQGEPAGFGECRQIGIGPQLAGAEIESFNPFAVIAADGENIP